MAKIISPKRVTINKLEQNLESIKTNIKDWSEYFADNFKRFNNSRRFVFETSLSTDDIDILKEMGKPQLEFNIQEAYISRLRGEFSKQEPSINIYSKATSKKDHDAEMIEFLQNHIYAILFDSNTDNFMYDVFTDCLSGGFSAIKVLTEYCSPMTFDQNASIQRLFDPTLSVFDKKARLSHKGDGSFSAELFPKTLDEVKDTYGEDIAKDFQFKGSESLSGFNWSYTSASGEKMVMIADYYEKKFKRKKIVQVTAGPNQPPVVMTEKEYEEFAEQWSLNRVEQVPVVIGKPRVTEIETIERYVICGNSIIEYNATDWRYLPHIFVDGNSLIMRRDTEGASYQLTRPFLYHAEGIQKLKNFAGICLANELENTVQHKFMIAKESIPDQYRDALTDIQKASVLVYNAYNEDNPTQPLPPPTAAPRSPIPPEITSTFAMADQMTQTILGSYDAALGINDNQLSGAAITAGAMQSNPVAMPFIVSFMKSMTQAGNIILDLIPKYIKTPRTLPVMNKKGKREYIIVNQEGGIKLGYDSYDLELQIEAGVSFEIQRHQALNMLTHLMQISPLFAQFMGRPNGLQTILDNVEIRGIERLKEDVEGFIQELNMKEQQAQQMQQQQAQQAQQMQAQQMQMAQQSQQQQLQAKAQKDAADIQNDQSELQLKAQKDQVDAILRKQKLEIERMLAQSEVNNQQIENLLRASEIDARNMRSEVDLIMKEKSAQHERSMDILKLTNSGSIGEINIEAEDGPIELETNLPNTIGE